MSQIVYLAGPITGLEFDAAKEWRDPSSEFCQRLQALGWETRSPMRDKEKFRVKGKLSAFFDEGAAAVNQDLQDIVEADAVILNVLDAERVSLGSMAEMGYAYATLTPVIVVTEGEENIHHHVFTDYMAERIVPDLNSAIEALVEVHAERKARRNGNPPYAPPLPELHRAHREEV